MMTVTDMIDVADLPLSTPGRVDGVAPMTASAAADVSAQSLEEHEKRLVMNALEQAGGNQSQAARQLHIGRDALRYKMKKFGLM
jgi:transcriptional regulator with PAS, ATPase and Fis domain